MTLRETLLTLYLRGPDAPSISSRRGSEVLCALRREPDSDPRDVLGRSGFYAEAVRLDVPSRRDWASAWLNRVEAITVEEQGYPLAWRRLANPPIALFECARARAFPAPYVVVVGTRQPSAGAAAWIDGFISQALPGWIVASGAAPGCDALALDAARNCGLPSLAVVPLGLNRWRADPYWCHADRGLSLAPPNAPFSTALAMERNGLLFELADAFVVADCRLREGGAWHAAVHALRCGNRPVYVNRVGLAESAGRSALVNLGAFPIETFPELLAPKPSVRSQLPLLSA